MAEAVNSLAAALTLSEARQRNFLLSVSHDLRTPLTAINGYAESLAEGVVTPSEVPEVGGVLLGEGRRLERLVGDLLDLARLQALHLRIDPQELDLVALGQATATVWARRCAARGALRVRGAGGAGARPDGRRPGAAGAGRTAGERSEGDPRGAPIVLELRVVGGAEAGASRSWRSATVVPAWTTPTSPWRSSRPPSTSGTAGCGRWGPDWGSPSCSAWFPPGRDGGGRPRPGGRRTVHGAPPGLISSVVGAPCCADGDAAAALPAGPRSSRCVATARSAPVPTTTTRSPGWTSLAEPATALAARRGCAAWWSRRA